MSPTLTTPLAESAPIEQSTAFDPSLTYMSDPMHFPAPVSPLFQSMLAATFAPGFSAAARSFELPIAGMKVAFDQHYFYQAYIPVIPADAAAERALGKRTEAHLQREIPRQMERWEAEYLPRVKSLNARLAAIELDGVAGREIPALLDEVVAIGTELWTIHFKIVVPMLLAMQLFDELYADLFDGTEQDAHTLLTGLPSESVKAGAGLSDLAAAAKAAGLDGILLSTPADEVIEALQTVPIGEYYVAAIRDYLREYGLRQDLFEYNVPTWQEVPSIAIMTIQGYLRSGHDARADHEHAMKSAVAAMNKAREQLATYPVEVRAQFEGLAQAARAAYFLQEEHNFYIDQRSLALQRLFFLKLGERLVGSGVLARADDVFMLSLDELKDVSSRALSEAEIGDVRILVLVREYEVGRAAEVAPAPFIGAPPAGPPPGSNPMDRAMIRFFGAPPEARELSNQLCGNAGSRGCARGVARVARTLDEAKSLQPGEILVAVTTMPAWTPLFGIAAALVTETGGPLSHGAIVAREYGIPAVVGAPGATRAIETGQIISVDGSTGTVTIEG